jgi:Flp pilus assembly protein TadB
VPLSEHEQRQLEQIEQALYREDPKFGRLVRSSDPRVHYKRKIVQALIVAAAGAGLIAAGVVTHRTPLEFAGAVLLALALLWAVVNWRQHAARTRAARAKTKGSVRYGRRGSDRKQARGGFMERLEERWRRRQDPDRRM